MKRDFSQKKQIKPRVAVVQRSKDLLESVDERFNIKKIFIYTEGGDERKYFNGLEREFNSTRVEIICEDCGGSDSFTVAKKAQSLFESNIEDDSSPENYEKYLVFDADDNFTRIDLKTGKSKAELAKEFCVKENFGIIFSNMCLEVWILCHYCDPFISFRSEDLCDRKFLKKETKKRGNRYSKLKLLQDVAIKNAQNLIKMHKANKVDIYSKRSNPVTQIGELILHLKKEYER